MLGMLHSHFGVLFINMSFKKNRVGTMLHTWSICPVSSRCALWFINALWSEDPVVRVRCTPSCTRLYIWCVLLHLTSEAFVIEFRWTFKEYQWKKFRRMFLKYQIIVPSRWATVHRSWKKMPLRRIELTNRKQNMENRDNVYTDTHKRGECLQDHLG